MRDQLIRYVDLLFAGAPDASDVKQEILQNTLDRYDDLIAQGKAPAAAYSLAISGIGDVSEILSSRNPSSSPIYESMEPKNSSDDPGRPLAPAWKKLLRAIGVCLYIICPIPLFILSEIGMDTIGLCGTLGIVAVATALMVIASGRNTPAEKQQESAPADDPRSELRKAVNSIIWAVGLCLYFLLSFATNAWYITWIIFPLIGAVQGLAAACMDLKEAK